MTILSDLADVVIGVDTHVMTHSAAVVDARTGAVLEEVTVPATPAGYADLVQLADQHSPARAWAVEGTGSHGAGLNRVLTAREEVVIELDRPVRAKRRHGAKSDPLDAVRAAREALSRTVLGTPRATGGDRQALSVLLAARSSAVKSGAVAQQQLFSLIVAAPEPVRAKFRDATSAARLQRAARLRTKAGMDAETVATITALRALAQRVQYLNEQADTLQTQITTIVRAWRADLLDLLGVGPIVAATVLCAWSHPGRLRSEAAFAMLAGTAPVPANSGQISNRYRLNRHGDRQLNRAIHTIALTRLRHDPTTRAYAARRTSQGKNPKEIRRCLKRYIARDLYRHLENPPTPLDRT